MNQFDFQRKVMASDLDGVCKWVLVVIGSHVNWPSMKAAFPSINTLVNETGFSKATIHRAKQKLVSQGYLVSERRFNKSNTYLVQIPSLTERQASITERLGWSQSEELIDNITDNIKDNRSSESKDSSDTNILNLKESEKDSDTINIMDWFDNGYPQRDKRTGAPGRRHQNAGRSRENFRRNDPDHAEVSRFIEDMAGARKQDW